jgi:putative addiction module component (TIGR02574 family)
MALNSARHRRTLKSMSRPALLAEILDLPTAERLRLVEDIWDSLATSIDQLPVPEWHREELDHRLADPAEQATISVDELKARLR